MQIASDTNENRAAMCIQRCDAEPVWPDPATLPKNDACPGIALLERGVYAGRDCRTVVAGWVAWWACQKAVAADPEVKCDALAEIMRGLRTGRGAADPVVQN